MIPLDDTESTLRKSVNMLQASFRTVCTDVNEDNKDATAWANLLNIEGGEDGKDRIHLRMYQRETPMAKKKLQVDNVV